MVERNRPSSRPVTSDPEESAPRMGPGTVVDGRYRIVSHLGEGGMGTVLIAEHLGLGRRVALKVLQERIGDDPTMRKRFQREARTLAAMSHPNIVAMNDYGIWDGMPYLVMELLSGRTLRDLLDVEPVLPVERALDIVQQVLRALSYAHAQGVIHRDLKPGNVFLQALPDQIDHVKLLDFGFAKFVQHQPTASFVSADGIVVGTPAYMAPEQAGGTVDHRADVYGGGVLLFEMLSGRRPFEGDPLAMIRGRMTVDPPTLAEVRPGFDISPELESALARALARRPEDRFQGASELSAALARVTASAVQPAGSAAAVARRSVPQPAPSKATPKPEEIVSPAVEPPFVAPSPSLRRRGRALLWIALALGSVAGIVFAAWRASPWAGPASDPMTWLAAPAEAPSEAVIEAAPAVHAEAPPTAAEDTPSIPEPRVEVPAAEVIALEEIAVPMAHTESVLLADSEVSAGDDAVPTEGAGTTAPALTPVLGPDPAIAQTAPGLEVTPASGEAQSEVVAEVAPAPAPSAIATTGPPDPWARDIPPALLALRARIESARPAPTAADLQRVGTYARHQPDDVRALVLLAHGYVRARWMTEALERYAEAHAADAEVRGDPRMRENLVTLASSAIVGARAGELVRRIYGTEALGTIDAVLAAGGLDAAATRRLRALRDVITAQR